MATPPAKDPSPDGYCTAKRHDGQPCRARAIKGGRVCFKHGGNLPRVKEAGRFRLRRDKAQQEALERLRAEKAGRVETINEMDRLAAEAIAFKDVVREHLEELEEIRYKGNTGEQLRAEVALYERALDRCNTILATNLKLGIAEKRAELDKQKAILVAAAIRAVLARLELSDAQQRMAPTIIKEELLAISAEVE